MQLFVSFSSISMVFFFSFFFFFFFFNDTATTEIYTLSLHDALPIERCPHFEFGYEHDNAVLNAALLPIAKRALIGHSHRTRKQRNPRPFAAGLRTRKPPPRPRNYCPGGVIILDDYMQPHCQGH